MNNSYLFSDGACLVENNIWMINVDINSICTLNTENGNIDLIRVLNGENRSIFRLYEKDGKILGFPGKGKNIFLYEIYEHKISFFQENTEKKIWCQYYAVEEFKDSIYLFPMKYSKIMKVNLKNLNQVEFISLPFKNEDKNGYFTKRFIRNKNMVIIPCAGINEILFFDLETNDCLWKNVKFCKNGFEDIEVIKEKIYLLTKDNKLIITSCSFELEREIILHESYNFVVACEEYVILVPKGKNRFAKISLKDFSLNEINYPTENVFCEEYLKKGLIPFSDIVSNEENIFVIPRFNNMLIKINKKSGMVDFQKWQFSEQFKKDILIQILNEGKIIDEEKSNLRDYIALILSSKKDK